MSLNNIIPIVLFILVVASQAAGDTEMQPDKEQVIEAIQWTLTDSKTPDGYILRPYDDMKLYDNWKQLDERAAAFLKASDRFDIPVYLLVGIAYRESVYDQTKVGDHGRSLGVMQVGKQGRISCREYCQDVHTVEGGIMCGGCWLDKGRSWCGTLEGGLNAYCHGGCSTKSTRGIRAVQIRLKLQTMMEGMF